MAADTPKKHLSLVMILLLIIAVQGAVIFSLAEMPGFDVPDRRGAESGKYHSIGAYSFSGWQAIEALEITKTRDFPPALFRNGLLRIFLLSAFYFLSAVCVLKSFNKLPVIDRVYIAVNNKPMKLLN